MGELVVEDAVVEVEVSEVFMARVFDGFDPHIEDVFDAEVVLTQEDGVAESGVAVAFDDEGGKVAVFWSDDAKFGAEDEVGAEDVDRCRGGEQFHIACGHEQLIGIDLSEVLIVIQVFNGDAVFGVAEIAGLDEIAERGLDINRKQGAAAEQENNQYELINTLDLKHENLFAF